MNESLPLLNLNLCSTHFFGGPVKSVKSPENHTNEVRPSDSPIIIGNDVDMLVGPQKSISTLSDGLTLNKKISENGYYWSLMVIIGHYWSFFDRF